MESVVVTSPPLLELWEEPRMGSLRALEMATSRLLTVRTRGYWTRVVSRSVMKACMVTAISFAVITAL